MSTNCLTDADILTEYPYREDRAAESAQIETEDDGLIALHARAFQPPQESERVRALLFPHSFTSFLADYYEKSWLFIERGKTPRPHEGLYSIAAMLEDFRRQRMPIEALQFVTRDSDDHPMELERDDFSVGSVLNFERIAEYVENNAGSIVLYRIESFVGPIFDLVTEIANDLRAHVQVNAYYTPPDSRAFDIHWDMHDVFVIQLEGSKRWNVHESLVPLPLLERDYTHSRRSKVSLRPWTSKPSCSSLVTCCTCREACRIGPGPTIRVRCT
jgi:hypothetical protein